MKNEPQNLEESISRLVSDALKEDLAEKGDITSTAVIPKNLETSARLVARESLVICGHEVAREVCSQVDSLLQYTVVKKEGERVVFLESEAGRRVSKEIATIKGSARSILVAERTILNFMQRLSGVSSIASEMSSILSGKKAKIVDTRKTTPGFRLLEKYAVKIGGGVNHRIGLYDAFLIKDNHIDSVGGDLKAAVRACREFDSDAFLQVEVRNFTELSYAIDAEPDSVLLDNMSPDEVDKAVNVIYESKKNIVTELSGGINLNNLASYADCKVDRISSGALTHSAKSKDLALEISLKG